MVRLEGIQNYVLSLRFELLEIGIPFEIVKECDYVVHLTYSEKAYLESRDELSQHGEMVSEQMEGGTKVANFRLDNAVEFPTGEKIRGVQLLLPKQGRLFECFVSVGYVVPDLSIFRGKYGHLKLNFKPQCVTLSTSQGIAVFQKQPLV